MNKHIFLDSITASVASLFSGKSKFFASSLQSPTFEEQVDAVKLKLQEFSAEGIYEVPCDTLVGKMDSAFYVASYKGADFPTIIYHHGNNERPFDFSSFAKNTFYNIFINTKKNIDANLIVVRAPFHNSSLKDYQNNMLELKNFVGMLATSVRLNEEIINAIKKTSSKPIITSGISLGGWVTNLHRGIYNTSTAYAPLMAGALLGELFLKSKYSKMTSNLALQNPQKIRELLNFDKLFKKHNTQNLYPLLSKYDQFIKYDTEMQTYEGYPLKTIEYGHVSGALNFTALREHLVYVLELLETQHSCE